MARFRSSIYFNISGLPGLSKVRRANEASGAVNHHALSVERSSFLWNCLESSRVVEDLGKSKSGHVV
jgi:hypothetical protein